VFISSRQYTRRDFLARTSAGFGALAFSALARLNAADKAGRRPTIDPLNPFAPRQPDFKPTAKSVIFLFMVGGPSHVDTFDYKPELQKLDGKPVPDSIKKAVEGDEVRECVSRLQRRADGQSVSVEAIRPVGNVGERTLPERRATRGRTLLHSLASGGQQQSRARELSTSHRRYSPGQSEPRFLGDIRTRHGESGFAGYVMLFDAGPLGGAANYSNGFLPAAFQPTRLRDAGTPGSRLDAAGGIRFRPTHVA
jgi:hypothetical protein